MLLNNDYVRWSDVMNVACSDCYCCATIDEFEDTTCPVKKKYMSIPAADVEPIRHGRWIDENPASPLDPRMRCSVCEHVEVPMRMWRFCPMCGARMDAESSKEKKDD